VGVKPLHNSQMASTCCFSHLIHRAALAAILMKSLHNFQPTVSVQPGIGSVMVHCSVAKGRLFWNQSSAEARASVGAPPAGEVCSGIHRAFIMK